MFLRRSPKYKGEDQPGDVIVRLPQTSRATARVRVSVCLNSDPPLTYPSTHQPPVLLEQSESDVTPGVYSSRRSGSVPDSLGAAQQLSGVSPPAQHSTMSCFDTETLSGWICIW